SYVIAPDTTYFVKDRAGSVWKIVFTGFGGSATGDMNFNQELMSPAALSEVAVDRTALQAWPNPVEGGLAQVQLAWPQAQGMLRVFNAAGRQVAAHQWNQATGVLALDVQDLAAGVYTLRFEADKAVATGKLVVQ
ncbi:MAG TPA: T9SS type A sorting domain-containing protein, partial [Flavobacteriales bacterium]|nr:T9SS type A sorting domain-containing protein [Flavobacteriales bacterium]